MEIMSLYDEIEDVNRLLALLNKLDDYEKYLYEENKNRYIIVGKDIFRHGFGRFYFLTNDVNHCWGCWSEIKNGICVTCHCEQQLKLTNDNGEIFIYKRGEKYRRKLIIYKNVSGENIINEFWLEKKGRPCRLSKWVANYDKCLVILQLRSRTDIFPIELWNIIIEYWSLVVLKI
jgi:hypothetical protein